MSAEYLAGLATPFAFAALLFGGFVVYVRVGDALSARGWFVHFRRDLRFPDGYHLRRDIWTERQVGPIFFGHWVHQESDGEHVNRWVGIGARGRWGWFAGKSRPTADHAETKRQGGWKATHFWSQASEEAS